MMMTFLIDYYLTASVLFLVATAAVFAQKNPTKRVLLVRGVFVAVLLLPIILLIPGRQLVSWKTATPTPVPISAQPPIDNVLLPKNSQPEFFEPKNNESPKIPFRGFVSSGKAEPVPQEPLPDSEPVDSLQDSSQIVVATNSVTVVAENREPKSESGKTGVFLPLWKISWANTFLVVQIFATVFVAIWQVYGYVKTKRFVCCAIPLDANMKYLENTANCRVRTHPKLVSPILVGFFKPTIYLPITDDATEVSLAIAHENAHLENGDLSAIVLERFVMLLLPLHPLFWILRRVMRRDQEMLADLRTVESVDRFEYTQQLLHWARRNVKNPIPARIYAGMFLGMIDAKHTKTTFKGRIQMLFDETIQMEKTSTFWRFTLFGLTVFATVFVSVFTLQPLPGKLVTQTPPVQEPVAATSPQQDDKNARYSLGRRYELLIDRAYRTQSQSLTGDETTVPVPEPPPRYPTPSEILSMYEKGGFDAVKRFYETGGKHLHNGLGYACSVICESLAAEKKFDEIAEFVKESGDVFAGMHAVIVFYHSPRKEYDKTSFTEVLKVAQKVAGDQFSESEFARTVRLCVPQLNNAEEEKKWLREYMIQLYETVKSLDNHKLESAFAAQVVEGCLGIFVHYQINFFKPQMLDGYNEFMPLCEAALRGVTTDAKWTQEEFQLYIVPILFMIHNGRGKEYTSIIDACWQFLADEKEKQNDNFQAYADALRMLELENGMLEELLESVLKISSIAYRNENIQQIMSWFGSSDTPMTFDLMDIASGDSFMELVYLKPLLKVKDLYGRLLLMMSQHEMFVKNKLGGTKNFYTREMMNDIYLSSARSQSDPFAKAESLGIIAAAHAWEGKTAQATAIGQEALDAAAQVADPIRRKYAEILAVSHWAALKNKDAFRKYIQEKNIVPEKYDEFPFQEKCELYDNIRFWADVADDRSFSLETLKSEAAMILDGLVAPKNYWDHNDPQQRDYYRRMNKLDNIAFVESRNKNIEAVKTIIEMMEKHVRPFDMMYSDIFESAVKVDKKYALEKVEQWLKSAAKLLGEGKYNQRDDWAVYHLFEKLSKNYSKAQMRRLLNEYLDSLSFDKPAVVMHFCMTLSKTLTEEQYEKPLVEPQKLQKILAQIEKILPQDDGVRDAVMPDRWAQSVIPAVYRLAGETEKADQFPPPGPEPKAMGGGGLRTLVHIADNNDENLKRETALTALLDAAKTAKEKGTTIPEQLIRDYIAVMVDSQSVIETGSPKDFGTFLTILAEHENREILPEFVQFLENLLEKCRKEQNGNGQIQAAANLVITLTFVEGTEHDSEALRKQRDEVKSKLPSDMYSAMRLVGLALSNRYEQAEKEIETLPEEHRNDAREMLEKMKNKE